MLNDVVLHRRNVGGKLTDQELHLWAERQRAFYFALLDGQGAAQKAPKALSSKSGPIRAARAVSGQYIQALDKQLQDTFGTGLDAFFPTPGAATTEEEGPNRRKTLVLHQDEGSPGFAISWFLVFKLRLRCMVVRDVLHRDWNAVKQALKGSQVWWAVLLTTVTYNLTHGPWNGGGWFQKLVEGGEDIFGKLTPADPFCEPFVGTGTPRPPAT